MREDLHGDVKPREFAPRISHIRVCTAADIDWLMELAKTRYEAADYDEAAVRAWLLERFNEPTMVFMRGKHSFGCCNLARRYMAPNRLQAYLTVLASYPVNHLSLEPLRIGEALCDWARSKGASKFWFSDVTGNDLAPLVTRLNGRFAGRNYVVDLDDKSGRYG